MPDRTRHPRPVRRSPSLGVSGVTLLMLVTLALTTTPTLAKGREIGTYNSTRLQQATERAMPTERAIKRLSGQREVPDRQIRPVGSGSLFSAASVIPLSLPTIEPTAAAVVGIASCPDERVLIALLNLPPPLC